MDETKKKPVKRNGKLLLHPLKFEDVVKGLLEVKPEAKITQTK